MYTYVHKQVYVICGDVESDTCKHTRAHVMIFLQKVWCGTHKRCQQVRMFVSVYNCKILMHNDIYINMYN